MTIAPAPTHDHDTAADKSAEKTVRLRIENVYADGHESSSTHHLALPLSLEGGALEDWWNDDVFVLTGDGHGAKYPGLDSSHSATVLEGPAELLGETYEWGP